jgi:hypothetical protein
VIKIISNKMSLVLTDVAGSRMSKAPKTTKSAENIQLVEPGMPLYNLTLSYT